MTPVFLLVILLRNNHMRDACSGGMGEERGVYRVLVGKPEGRRPLGRPRRRWVDNIRTISRRWDVGIWTGLGWPRIERGGVRL